jgi:hypothetical protein
LWRLDRISGQVFTVMTLKYETRDKTTGKNIDRPEGVPLS